MPIPPRQNLRTAMKTYIHMRSGTAWPAHFPIGAGTLPSNFVNASQSTLQAWEQWRYVDTDGCQLDRRQNHEAQLASTRTTKWFSPIFSRIPATFHGLEIPSKVCQDLLMADTIDDHRPSCGLKSIPPLYLSPHS
ncbi:hypothetical protein JAAARDRAFT_420231 [Jaapia argillacea MUCL 33604]|uniref:Uncharacterized protein n=1 Tax=Jaapia argillacea MUCL 33604 TaxID=933084 RepID=A0A067PFU7_9AGAM|nr:hypothetical protein JAAARDRAFT_420231 [Jaapia argillacea MUCL 33604]